MDLEWYNCSEKEEKKSQIIHALVYQGLAQADHLLGFEEEEAAEEGDESLASVDDLDATIIELNKWIESTDSKVHIYLYVYV